jgi:diadenosine tetraphosphate (Ap4A) HIT family hydrolase/5-methylcytosine-specific restriction endonuclease McrA
MEQSKRYIELKDFIQNRMKMSHVYQPVMLAALLKQSGTAASSEIASALLTKDQSQIDYYQHIVNGMVGKVLRSHNLVSKPPRKSDYYLEGYNELNPEEVQQLIALCDAKLKDFEGKRGDSVWEHRSRNRRLVSGSVRYSVLKRANFHCELCGIRADDKALEVDHIIPKSLGGADDIVNYQALCYSCNASKGNRDSTDLAENRIDYTNRVDECLFCEAYSERQIISENTLAYAIKDGFPVTEGHTLIIPKRHVIDYFGLSTAEVSATNQLLHLVKEQLCSSDEAITGFNIGMNAGESAGQSIFHCHTHLIPRRDGDVEDPRGGIRHVIGGKGYY